MRRQERRSGIGKGRGGERRGRNRGKQEQSRREEVWERRGGTGGERKGSTGGVRRERDGCEPVLCTVLCAMYLLCAMYSTMCYVLYYVI